MLKVKSLRFNPIRNRGENIDIPVRVELSFPTPNGDKVFKYNYDEKNPQSKVYECDFDFNLEEQFSVSGKLWALDRKTENRYFTLTPSTMPQKDNPNLEVNIHVEGPCIVWVLHLSN